MTTLRITKRLRENLQKGRLELTIMEGQTPIATATIKLEDLPAGRHQDLYIRGFRQKVLDSVAGLENPQQILETVERVSHRIARCSFLTPSWNKD